MDWLSKPSQQPLHREWNSEFYSLLVKSCAAHFGKEHCYNCYTQDTSTPWECSCESFTQRNLAGDICIKHRMPNPDCTYHQKEHYFETA